MNNSTRKEIIYYYLLAALMVVVFTSVLIYAIEEILSPTQLTQQELLIIKIVMAGLALVIFTAIKPLRQQFREVIFEWIQRKMSFTDFIIFILAFTICIFLIVFIDSLSNSHSSLSSDVNSLMNRIAIIACFITLIGAIQAHRSQNKSDTLQDDLIKMGLLNAPRESFEDIFGYDIIPNLKEMVKYEKDGKIYLLLSTPAYGYPVIDEGTYEKFREAIKALQTNSIEFMFFCPDAHYDYWCNLLLWSITYDKKEDFAIKFAKEICAMLLMIEGNYLSPSKTATPDTSTKRWAMWIKREVTIRLYSFIYNPKNPIVQTEEGKLAFNKVFICFVDAFNIALSQYDIAKARHMQIHPRDIEEYVGKNDSFFERTKHCPYTMSKDGMVAKDNIKLLIADFVFGLTSESKYKDYESFEKQFDLYFKRLKQSSKYAKRDEKGILMDILKILVNYYDEMIKYFLREQYLTLGKYLKNHVIIFKIINEKLSTPKILYIKALCRTINQIQVNITAKEYDQKEREISNFLERVDDKEKIKFTIYLILSAGFRQSAYYDAVVHPQQVAIKQ